MNSIDRSLRDGEDALPGQDKGRGPNVALNRLGADAQERSHGLRFLDTFSGVGMFARGLQRAGHHTAAFCEIDPFCRQVLASRFPGVPLYDDIRTVTRARLDADGVAVDGLCGGFPCQDLSIAGGGAGIDGERSGLWAELARLIGELRPRVAVMENVANLLAGDDGRWFGRVLGDLAALGYDAWWDCIPASAVGADHVRDRAWIVAYPQCDSVQGWAVAAAVGAELRRAQQLPRLLQSGVGPAVSAARAWRADHGPAVRLDVARNKAVGNGLVDRIPEILGRAIMAAAA